MPDPDPKGRVGYIILFEMVGLKVLSTESPPLTPEEIDIVRAFLERVRARAGVEKKKPVAR